MSLIIGKNIYNSILTELPIADDAFQRVEQLANNGQPKVNDKFLYE